MKLRNFLLAFVGVAALATSAIAQVNTVPQVGVITAINTKRATYSSVALALPPAASATDIACIAGSASKTVYIDRIGISGTAGTLVTTPFTLVRRTAVNTGGTAATTTANWANNISKLDSNDAAASATLISYSANPTINDTSPTYLRSANTTLPTTAAGTVIEPLVWQFGLDLYTKHLVLRGAAEQVCVNLNGVSVSSGVLQLSIEWTEQ